MTPRGRRAMMPGMDEQAGQTDAGVKLGTAVATLAGVGERRGKLFGRLGIHTVADLVRHLPSRYEQLWAEGAIGDLPMEGVGTARGTVVGVRWAQGARPRLELTLEDHSDKLGVVWFNAGYLRGRIHPGAVIRVQGKVRAYNGSPQMVNPKWEELTEPDNAPAADERIKPIYPATDRLPSDAIEQVIADVLPRVMGELADPLDEAYVKARAMPTLAESFRMAHRPEHEEEWKTARRRLAYNEMLLLQLGIALKRQYTQTQLSAPALRWSEAIDEHIRQRFPFELTDAQAHVVKQIVDDLTQPRPMNRLLQGDVGAGKTVVALYALLMAVANRKQGALMAPTELLAEQHHASITGMLKGANVRVDLLTAGSSGPGSPQRRALEQAIEVGDVDIIVGTQALLTESVRFHDLAVVVVDEQHRFGVMQRAAFRTRGQGSEGEQDEQNTQGDQAEQASDGGENADERRRAPHALVMTATPIPRTLSLTVFGDLDVSTINQLPPGRTPITTRVVPPDKADDVYRYLAQRVAQGEQAYVVVPTIDAGGAESAKQLASVKEHAKLLTEKYLPEGHVAAVHGRLKRSTRENIMHKFRRGEVDVLVATTVIEVGVDVPNATVMVVEHAERFGLAQLHQLRGRIGRGTKGQQSVCAFIADPTTDDATQRMAAIAATNDGFKIAEQDLAIRGMGEFFGTRQHGAPPLRVARIPEDMDLLQMARRDANDIAEQDPTLSEPAHERLRQVLIKQYGAMLEVIDVG